MLLERNYTCICSDLKCLFPIQRNVYSSYKVQLQNTVQLKRTNSVLLITKGGSKSDTQNVCVEAEEKGKKGRKKDIRDTKGS